MLARPLKWCWHHGEIIISTEIKNQLRTIEVQIVQKLKNHRVLAKIYWFL